MIQRKQTLFLLEIIFLGLALIFIPCQNIFTTTSCLNLYLLPNDNFQTTSAHLVAVILNITGILIATTTVFLFKKRSLQVKICYTLIALWVILTSMMLFCPFVLKTAEIIEIKINYFVVGIGFFSIIAAFFAAHFIRKDINLLKSADRIR
jgi:hypothetical protein